MQKTYNLISDAVKVSINQRHKVGYFGSITVSGETLFVIAADLVSAKNACIHLVKMLLEKRKVSVLPESISEPMWDDEDINLFRPHRRGNYNT